MRRTTIPEPASAPLDRHDLKRIGLKATLPRLKVLSIFERSEARHLSAEDVYRQLLSDHLDIGLATVYRVLMQFEQAGLLIRSQFDSSGKAVYELNEGGHHDHLICTICGRVDEFFDPEIERRQQRIAKAHGFTLVDHALSLYGVCSDPACQQQVTQSPSTTS